MTHEKLLEKLADIAHNKDAHEARNYYLLALRAVVKLHQQIDDNSCYHCATWYPCSTIQAIEKELQYD